MKTLVINHNAGSPSLGMKFRPYYMAREWLKMQARSRERAKRLYERNANVRTMTNRNADILKH